MPFRIREILLVSSAYDAFVLEEDGSLTDRLFYEYSELSLSWAPRITHARSGRRALELLGERRFDLVLTVVRVGDVDAAELSRSVRERVPDIPITLLIFDEHDLAHFPNARVPATIDRVFQWTGDASVFIAAIKSIEDHRNADHDCAAAGVQVILVVEDRVRSYSSFLALLYPELLAQSGSLIGEGLNDMHRLMRMRARPKIVLATTFDEGVQLFERYRPYICAVMSDIRIPHGGEMDPRGGFALAERVRAERSDLPILFQSAEPDGERHARAIGAWFLNKNAPDFADQMRWFLQEALGFGDFVFRLPDRTEVARARDVYEMEQALRTVPREAVAFHAAHNHFSVWLRARCLFPLADLVRPRRLADFADVEELRADLLRILHEARMNEQEGVITDLAARHTGPENRFVRVGRGSVGGKGRAVAFVSAQIVRHGLLQRYKDLQIRVPKTVVLGTDAFESFMDRVDRAGLTSLTDEGVTERMLAAPLPDEVMRDLHKAWINLKGPLAVRSSSLLEDSRFQPFAGVYATYMLPNNHPHPEVRFRELCRAIKAVYASVFWHEARTYMAGTPHEAEDQRMAVLIQQVVGQRFGERFYPAGAGVVQSYNYYPVGGQRAEDGVALIALGLGHTVVSGGIALRVSPGAPTVLPQFPTAEAFLRGSQSEFYAVDLTRSEISFAKGPEASLALCTLADAERDGTLAFVGSVYCAGDDVIRENLTLEGPRVVSFNNVLKWHSLPLAEALGELVKILRDGVGEEVEIEFALDIPVSPRSKESDLPPYYSAEPPMSERRGARLYVLQVRPMATPEARQLTRDLEHVEREAFLCRSNIALGHGSYEGIRDIIWVDRPQLDGSVGREIVRAVSELNDELMAAHRPYLLIGPGRWGTADPTLGVPVVWTDIAGARVIIETPIGTRRVEPSQGTHFFRNITAAHVGYITVEDREGSELDRGWLERAWRATRDGSSGHQSVRHIELEGPLGVHIDGRRGQAAVLKSASALQRPDSLPPPEIGLEP